MLFHEEDCASGAGAKPELVLERNEVIALVNLVERLSKAVDIVRRISLDLLERGDSAPHPTLGAIESLTDSEPLFQPYPFAAA